MTAQPRPSALVQPLDEMPPLRHRIHAQLERLITSGSLAPGTRLVESDLAQTLGVSRGPIREALQLLQRDGLIRYSRGHVTIVSAEGLRERSCECYALSKLEFDRLLGDAEDLKPSRQRTEIRPNS